ncbi:MAG: hypothetical protein MUO31_00240 [Thermodesulfovibrionales bacterium]|nr:hypothetical protein [Thermodesulfovibrionales bacterium]
MPHNTDEHLKSSLDTNQLAREQMCCAILANDRRFSDVHPRHPRGGPDGGRDIEATYQQELKAFGAIGFVNQANDSEKQKRQIKKKFKSDVKCALDSGEKPEVFIFFTNINFTCGEKDELIAFANKEGFKFCDLMDRERLRIALDSTDGFSIRFQFLRLPLSEEEQASFFAKWGDAINSLISTGFQKVEKKLDRILFLQEASEVLSSLTFAFQLKRIYDADEIGHFRAFISLFLKEPKLNILSILIGSSDKASRMRIDSRKNFRQEPQGIRHGISGGQWERYINTGNDKESKSLEDENDNSIYKCVGSSSTIGMMTVEFIKIQYSHDDLIRFYPRLRLIDFDDAIFMPILNSSLADKLRAIHIYANGYKIQEITESDFRIDALTFDPKFPVEFTEQEIIDGWVRIRPSTLASAFLISFSIQTPKRLFESPLASDSISGKRRDKIIEKKEEA